MGVGVLAHEMFHVLGAPDLYHYTDNGISPVGYWDLMEWNMNPPQHMSCYMKYKYGKWIGSIPTIGAGTYTLNPLTSSSQNCYKILSPVASTQYYVVEFRKDEGTFESSLPGSGLLVYRINTKAYGNASGPPDEVYVYRPGGTTTIDGNVINAYFSSESSRTAINSGTDPSGFLSNGVNGGLNLSAIGSAAGSTITFTNNTAPQPVGFNNSFNGSKGNWSAVKGSWGIKQSMYWGSSGIANKFASTKYKDTYGNFVFEARMKRSGICVTCLNGLVIRGDPTKLNTYYDWKPSYTFNYNNMGYFSVWRVSSTGTYSALKTNTFSSKIVRNGWNTLKVVANNSSLTFYINGAKVWAGSNSTLKTGKVGIQFERDANPGTLLVDWAKLTPTLLSPLPPLESFDLEIGEELPFRTQP